MHSYGIVYHDSVNAINMYIYTSTLHAGMSVLCVAILPSWL